MKSFVKTYPNSNIFSICPHQWQSQTKKTEGVKVQNFLTGRIKGYSQTFDIFIYFSYFKHIYTGYKFNKHIVLQFGPVKIKEPNKLFTNKLDKNIYI